MTSMCGRRRYCKDEAGAGAAEFALVLIPFLALIFGIIETSMMLYANHTLQYATEAAARCASIMNAAGMSCDTTAHIQTYATNHYSGPNIAPTFTYTASGCGHTVAGAANFTLNVVVVQLTVPLAATACFP